ncbi:hypothetical protein BJ986_000051 [Phycicoccus badiiscoriae]|uniref:Uncharacterized protein n=1 Tax=Pedococcus badiiscoriae TaxID=642776 RepID=A0A852WFV1_9MICO|nr:hypothetical protein [Pedococcus badiiscoriae]NYG05564.1 hypothetical protein [Pedococcus badiiscoriae]
MGFFGTFVYADGAWTEREDTPPTGSSLRVDIHDSDIAQIDYRPATTGVGRFYLGYEPAIYFEDPSASQPVDGKAEALGFSEWVKHIGGPLIAPEEILSLLADPGGAEPEEVFAEDAVVKLLGLAGLPLPESMEQGG